MSELNFNLLQENIRALLKKHNLTQSELAEIAGMSQSNLSKALNPEEKKQFTLEQLYRISHHFGVSMDEITGNKTVDKATTSPQSCLNFVTKLLCSGIMRSTMISMEEWVYEPYYNSHGYPDCKPEKKNVEYPAFYFADYHWIDDFANNEYDAEEVHTEFLMGGNCTKYQYVNEIFKKFIPVIKLYRETEIPDEAFQMVLKGYLEQLKDK